MISREKHHWDSVKSDSRLNLLQPLRLRKFKQEFILWAFRCVKLVKKSLKRIQERSHLWDAVQAYYHKAINQKLLKLWKNKKAKHLLGCFKNKSIFCSRQLIQMIKNHFWSITINVLSGLLKALLSGSATTHLYRGAL